MKIKFDSNQPHQRAAIEAICDLFKELPPDTDSAGSLPPRSPTDLFEELAFPNRSLPSEEAILASLRQVQARNGIVESRTLDGLNFSIEMETGTGKTYAYLRTIYELNARFGLKKFIVVVPSVAIREGVQKSIKMTREHLRDLYDGISAQTHTYDSKRLSVLRLFASSNQLQILVLNIDSFNKTANIILRENDTLGGLRPIDFIRACHPIVIIDEPQNMESDQAKAAIGTLNPLCTLRYSATHRNLYNLVYRLDPVGAYDLGLVKHIEVASVLEDENISKPYLHLESVVAKRATVRAKLVLSVRSPKGLKRRAVIVSQPGFDLHALTDRAEYEGYVVEAIDAESGCIAFRNGVSLVVGEKQGGTTEEVMRAQIQVAVLEHLEKELFVKTHLPAGKRVKVLTLFFIDRVANYAEVNGKIRKWFVAAYEESSRRGRYRSLTLPTTAKVHGGYFARVKGIARDTTGDSPADDEAYALIMRDKERLLSLDEPLRFIFSHSALREGWDNPNVFQICPLNESRSEVKKRQEIGRGLRLSVDESGSRCRDQAINRLTVVANESYDEFARALQTEIQEECGVDFRDKIHNRRDRKPVSLKKGWNNNSDFVELWNRIKHKTRYSVQLNSQELVKKAAFAISQLPPAMPVKIVAKKDDLIIGRTGITGRTTTIRHLMVEHGDVDIPDVLSFLQRGVELTRGTLTRILVESNRLGDLLVNPKEFMERTLRVIKSVLRELMVDGIQYERIGSGIYEMRLFEDRQLDGYISRMLNVRKSIFDQIEFDSAVERQFAEELEAREDIRLFLKLPAWFTVETPLGSYNPDWAIVKGREKRLYLVRETKGSIDKSALRGEELGKILCGKAHFSILGVDFQAVSSASEI
jgi:type III restriction enzyme